jgi:hypothetical protein
VARTQNSPHVRAPKPPMTPPPPSSGHWRESRSKTLKPLKAAKREENAQNSRFHFVENLLNRLALRDSKVWKEHGC